LTTADPGLDDWPVFIDLDLRHRWIYWVNGEDGVFYRVDLDGGEAEEMHEDPGDFGPFDMVVLERPPDPSPRKFRRGDADGSGKVDLTDALFVLEALFLDGTNPPCD